MKPIKKIFIPFLLATLAFSITGCNKDNNDNSNKDDQTQTPANNNNNNNTGNGGTSGNGGNTNPGNTTPGGNTQPGGNTNPGNTTPDDEPGDNTNPGTDNPGTDNPGTDNPGTDNPGTDNPGTDNPGTEPTNPNTNPSLIYDESEDTAPENKEIDANPEPTELAEPVIHETVTKSIGAAGGEIKDTDENLAINIPGGALTNDANISATYVEEPSLIGSAPSMNFMGAVDFGPSGTVFEDDVEVTIKLANTTYHNELSVFCYSEADDMWEYVTNASVSGKNATFNVRHFSRYQCLDITPEMLNKFVDLVHEAQTNDYTDAWILNAYKDYLINEERVMDEYAIYDGLYYEACGLFIAGQYTLENGKQGDPDALIEQVGESNKIGNTYGLSTVAGLTTSREESKKAKESTTENQEIIDVTVDIDYVMIKPNIELAADKVILEKNESTTVNVRTHYANPTNQKHPDIALPYYPLTLPYNLKHFSTDVKELTTDQYGTGTFTVTALSEGTENVKVMFYVEGYFGQYSANYIKVKCGGDYTITGHVSQTISGTFNGAPDFEKDGMTCTQIGSYYLTLEYDVVGAIDLKDDGTYQGVIQFVNATASFGGTEAVHYWADEDGSVEIRFTMFDDETFTIANGVGITFVANVDESKTCSLIASSINQIVLAWIDGNTHMIITAKGNSIPSDTPFIFLNELRNTNTLLLDFTLEAGTYTNSSSSLKDTYRAGAPSGVGADDWESIDGIYYQILSQTGSTEQEITVVDNRPQVNP